jgi:outer membrane protein assembly factor BamB
MKFRTTFRKWILFCCVAILSPGSTQAGNWPHWRGPFHNGSADEKDLPVSFSKTENVLWTAPMPGPAGATPIIWGQRVFISSVDESAGMLVALCLDRADGTLLWRREIAAGISRDERSNYAAASPVTDGSLVYFFYGNGDLVAFDFAGTKVWARNIQKEYGQFAFLWTFAASPTLYDDKLFIQVLQRNVPVSGRGRSDGPNHSYVLALDPKTGAEIWKQIRLSEARQESLEAFSTPIPFTHGARAELLVVGGDCITGHDPATGRELWRWGTWNPKRITHWRLVPSPVAGSGVVLACAPKGSPVYAIKAGGKGNLDDSHLAWISQDREISTDVSTPLFYKDRFFVLNSDRRTISCVEPGSGRVVWIGELEGRSKFEASPTGADGKIYMMNHRGDVQVIAAGDEFKLLHNAAMGDEGETNARSTVAVSDGQLFIRTGRKLYCVGSR